VAERRMCDVCVVRPAVTTMKRIAPGEPPRTEYLCEVHAAQARGGRMPLGGRSSFGGAAASSTISSTGSLMRLPAEDLWEPLRVGRLSAQEPSRWT
jgi:hypothetical protein